MGELGKIIAESGIVLAEAKTLLENGFYRGTVNRAYYAMFTAVLALLFTEGVVTKTHTGALSRFHELFIKTGKLPEDLGSSLNEAFNKRQRTDYNFDFDIDKDTADHAFLTAERFVSTVIIYISNQA
jgi:hypothetical protein